jgi:hypothetical protein
MITLIPLKLSVEKDGHISIKIEEISTQSNKKSNNKNEQNL